MKTIKVLGIYRHPQFSNNAIEADRLILRESMAQLEALSERPVKVELIEEDEALEAKDAYDLVLTMAQNDNTLRALERNLSTSPVWNSPASIRNCYRKTMSRLLSALPVGYVPYRLLRTDDELASFPAGDSFWLKRSDFHAISDDDVTLTESTEETQEKLARFRSRGVQEVIVQRHIHGDVYKFYGVKGKFFRAIKVRSLLPGETQADFSLLQQAAVRAAEALGLLIYGGDCILDAAGRFHLIDLNDWPSFRICREDAARAIGTLAAEQIASPDSVTASETGPVAYA